MPYNIRSIDMVGLQKKKYFFDSNMWLKILKPKFTLNSTDKKYLDFFQKFKDNTNNPKIVLTALVLSEVINRYLRDVTYSKFCKKNNLDQNNKSLYKSAYRPSDEFQTDYISLCEDIKAYQNHFELVQDGLSVEIKQKDILTSPSQHLDFNDNYYYKLALKREYILVTDDSDFFVPDVEIITLNNQLLDKFKSTITPTTSP